MNLSHPVLKSIDRTPLTARLRSGLPRAGERSTIGGIVGSAGTALVATLYATHPRRIFVLVAPDPGAADEAETDLESLLGGGVVHLFPQYESHTLAREDDDPRIDALRVEAVEALLGEGGRIFVTTLRALRERMAVPERLADLQLDVETGQGIRLPALVERLDSMGYRRTPLVEEIGQYALRGGLVDVFSLGLADPIRIEFFGNEIATIRSFEVTDQRSTADMASVRLLPAAFPGEDGPGGEATRPRSLLEILPSEAILVAGDEAAQEDVSRDRRPAGERNVLATGADEGLLMAPAEARRLVLRFPRLVLTPEAGHDLCLGASRPPTIERKMERLVSFLRAETARGIRTLILCDNGGQIERLEEILSESGPEIPGVQIGLGTLEAGFRIAGGRPLNVLTDHEIFRRRRRILARRRFRGAMALESVAQLAPGDYVVHMEHGIGRFQGLKRIEIHGESLEVLVIRYANGETLNLPVYRLDLIERWVGESEETEPPAVHRIGGRRWKALRRKTEAAIEKLTRELLDLYAEREVAEGFAFSPDSRWQTEMEAGFLYEDTPDQRRVTREVKRDMESPRPMDRLICGDVGLGKTEVAIRAAFKAVLDGKQVALLAPTTILVEQHERTFAERLADFPVRVESISRFRTARQQQQVIADLAAGKVDIVVGTHRLLSGDLAFRDLGLLIVDEEQRFGVRHKEAIKRLRASVDVLTLTATPIPRTLQLSLAGVRSLSFIRTAPRDRLSVVTRAVPWSDTIIAEVLGREMDRAGQTFFLHNRVQTIDTVAGRLRRILPEARISLAHGQMPASKLDGVMRDFMGGAVDILVCSSIIENGLDVPNANTLVVDRADRFGLAQLYQIRGRVGRSNRRAFCYLIVPETMTPDAETRIRLLERYTELGSGYQVALRDLEIRGAGNLLGQDQSGFAHAVGMDTYLRLLEEAVRRIRRGPGAERAFPEPDILLPGSAYIPDDYVSDAGQKLHLYRRLSKLEDRSEIAGLREEIRDRFGPLPEEVERLIDAKLLRLLGQRLGIERIFVRGGEGRLTFRSDANPRMATLEVPFRDRQVAVGVRRIAPLSLSLTRVGPEALARTLTRALDAIAAAPQPAAWR